MYSILFTLTPIEVYVSVSLVHNIKNHTLKTLYYVRTLNQILTNLKWEHLKKKIHEMIKN